MKNEDISTFNIISLSNNTVTTPTMTDPDIQHAIHTIRDVSNGIRESSITVRDTVRGVVRSSAISALAQAIYEVQLTPETLLQKLMLLPRV